MNNGELKQEVLDIAHMTLADTVGARVAKFVKRAEDMIAQSVRALEMITDSVVNDATRVSPTSGSYNVAGALDVISVSNGTGGVERCSLPELLRYSTTGAVHHYAVRNLGGVLRLDFRGIPATGSVMGASHYSRLAALTADVDVNALLTAHEGLYVHAALHWLYIDARNFEASRGHGDLFFAEAERVNAIARRELRAGSVASIDYGVACSRSAM